MRQVYFNPLPPYGGRLTTVLTSDFGYTFQSTPSVWRETVYSAFCDYPLPLFQSTPSVWRETFTHMIRNYNQRISIHSLRMEGDFRVLSCGTFRGYFNPLPPYGGRPVQWILAAIFMLFQSTPSVWRETCDLPHFLHDLISFQSTPSVWRETSHC